MLESCWSLIKETSVSDEEERRNVRQYWFFLRYLRFWLDFVTIVAHINICNRWKYFLVFDAIGNIFICDFASIQMRNDNLFWNVYYNLQSSLVFLCVNSLYASIIFGPHLLNIRRQTFLYDIKVSKAHHNTILTVFHGRYVLLLWSFCGYARFKRSIS